MPGPNPLTGFTVGITADRRWDEQAALFERRGATVMHGPSIRTLPLGEDAALRTATESLIGRPPDIVVANTGLGIRSWLGAADSWDLGAGLHTALGRARIYARGPKAFGAVHSAGLAVAARAPTERLSEAVDLVLSDLLPGQRVAVQVDGSGDSPEVARLERAGADVVVVPVYLWQLPEDRKPAVRLIEAVIAGRVHAVTFTAGPAVRNWLAIAADHNLDGALRNALGERRVVLGCVGPVCADVAASETLPVERLVVPSAYRLGPMVRAVADGLVAQTMRVAIGEGEIVLSGTVATIDGASVPLTDTEARLLHTLAGQPDVVFTKEHLLRVVWAGVTDDPHAVEVTIGRLRRRLGAHGTAVSCVQRRGYTLRTQPV